MKFVEIQNRRGMINLDGYSDRKTLRGALRDLAREVAKIDKGEAAGITNYMDETLCIVREGMTNEPGCWYIEAQEVNGASRYIFLDGDKDNYDDDNLEIEYADACWYLYIRFAAC